MRNRAIIFLVAAVILVMLSMSWWVSSLPNSTLFNVINAVIASSIIGSLVNQSQRADAENEIHNYGLYLLWKCSVAISFAVLLYLLFVSGIIQGSVFPSFQESESGFSGFSQFVKMVQPATNEDVAKCIVWGFVAGYVERFVPNLLNRVVSKADGE